MKLRCVLPEYQNVELDVDFSFWTNRPSLRVNGNAISPIPGNRRAFNIQLPDQSEVRLEFKGFTIDFQPRVFMGGKQISIVRRLKWYETILGGLPAILLFFGGAIGGLCAFIGVTANFNLLRSERPFIVRLLASLTINALTYLAFGAVNSLIRQILG